MHAEIAGAPINEVQIDIYDFAIRFTADNAAKWAPDNIETADHSLPFLAAHALVHGKFGPGSLHGSLHDARVRALCARIKVVADPNFSARFPQATPSRVTIRAKGRTFVHEIAQIIGHQRRPMSFEDVRRKFMVCATPLAGADGAAKWFALLARAEEIVDLSKALTAPA